jgi:hypothetical protein
LGNQRYNCNIILDENKENKENKNEEILYKKSKDY